MCRCCVVRPDVAALLAIAIVAMVMLSCSATTCDAGILLPQEVSFDAQDLEQTLKANEAGGASSAPARDSDQSPPPKNDSGHEQLGLLKGSLPVSNSSSSSSSSSAGGAVGSGIVLCLFNSTIAIADDAPLGRLAEEHGLSLPDPPGTDLLRPPRG